MNFKSFILLSAMFLAGCNQAPAERPLIAVTATLSCAPCANVKGSDDFHVWAASDKVALGNISTGESGTATALMPSTSSSNFIFNIGEPLADESLVSWFPAGHPLDFSAEKGIVLDIPSVQDGKLIEPVYFATGKPAPRKITLTLAPQFAVLYVNIPKGSFKSLGVKVTAPGGEKISGKVTFSGEDCSEVSADESEISVSFAEPYDNEIEGLTVPVAIAPVYLSKGYRVVVDTPDGDIVIEDETPRQMARGEGITTSGTSSSVVTEIVFCGSNFIYLVDADLAMAKGYKEAVLWSIDIRKIASQMGISGSTHNIDDCKVVDGGRKILATCSNNGGWCALIDMATSKPVFYVNSAPNAHSAEIVDGRVYIATSDGTDRLRVYSLSQSNVMLNEYPLVSAHGVVYCGGLLYAIGGNIMNIYQIDGDALKLVDVVTTPKSGLHDLSLVNSHTLCVSGNCSYLYDTATRKFTEIPLLRGRTALKSVNYNADTNEMWYTDSTVPEGGQTWSTQTICYSNDPSAGVATRTFKVPDLNVYKCRVKNW